MSAMYKMSGDDFIFEVREELLCYEDIGKKGADLWEKGFRDWLKKNPRSSVELDDESVIFEIADEYLEAFENNNTEGYWKSFRL